VKHVPRAEIPNLIIELESRMEQEAERLNFEAAIQIRDRIRKLRERAT